MWRLSRAGGRAAFGPKRTFASLSALAVARVAAGAARRGLILERSSAERADCPVVLARGSGRRTHYASCGRCVRTAAARMTTKCAARTDPRAALLGAPEIAPTGLRLPRRWACGFRDVGARVSLQLAPTQHAGVTGPGVWHSNQVAGSGRRCVRRSGIKEEPAGRGTAAEPNAPSAWSHTTPPVSGLPCFWKRSPVSALGRKRTLEKTVRHVSQAVFLAHLARH